ncbi:putative ABC transport system permease protein [Kitasatospora sp. MAA4]|uniref:ABC transporter permease n=1 Tax=Kitasatospora sp. MAA4 TaxID=3035093 RepID=UPI002475D439|nr:FtsX-like permease family protein [Kitasatospora sp. MAA4]MDH6132758.1 putative ABC transport system permease protein [Kitasatospora sp. MAA4]
MSAVWQVSRAAVRRRKLQTFVIGLVVLTSTVALVVALGLLDAASTPFGSTFDKQRGAQLTATFDPASVSDAQLADAAHRPGVAAVAGPFAEAVLTALPRTAAPVAGVDALPPEPITVVGRADPAGPVDRVDLWAGRWVRGPGEVVLMRPPGQRYGANELLGNRIQLPGAPPLTIVGFASTISQTAGAWVSPDQMPALHPTATQLLYRFTGSGTAAQVRDGLATVTAGLPQGALLGSLSYLTVKQDMTGTANAYVPFLMAFGILGLVVAVLIVANVVSGAVVSGYRHIGVLKSLGYTPNQVVSVYLVMVLVPGVAGAVLGSLLGDLAAQPLLHMVFSGFDYGYFNATLNPWVDVVTLLGMPAVILLAALFPALRAHRLSAARAISAGSAPTAGRGLRIQCRLSGTRLPRAVSLGLGLPVARPGRSALTLIALVLGVTTVTLASGLSSSVAAFIDAGNDHVQSVSYVGDSQAPGMIAPTLTDPQIEEKLSSLPGAQHVVAAAPVQLHMAGSSQIVRGWFLRGDSAGMSSKMLKGRWMSGPDEVVVGSPFVTKHGLTVGDHLTLERGGQQKTVTIVGEMMSGDADAVDAPWETLTELAPDWGTVRYVNQYWVQLAPGTNVDAYDSAVSAAVPGLYPSASGGTNSISVTIVGSTSLLTLLLATVAALGVFNTVVLNTRERRRDLGMLKSIGMTPRQVTVMMVVSMAALGVVGGLLGVPLGLAAHHLVVPAMVAAVGSALPDSMMNVWHVSTLALLLLAGVAIAVLGALVPARSAARLTIAEVLRSE